MYVRSALSLALLGFLQAERFTSVRENEITSTLGKKYINPCWWKKVEGKEAFVSCIVFLSIS